MEASESQNRLFLMEDGGKRYSCSNALGQSEAPQIDIYWNERRDHVHLEYMCSRERFRNRFTSQAGKISAAFIAVSTYRALQTAFAKYFVSDISCSLAFKNV